MQQDLNRLVKKIKPSCFSLHDTVWLLTQIATMKCRWHILWRIILQRFVPMNVLFPLVLTLHTYLLYVSSFFSHNYMPSVNLALKSQDWENSHTVCSLKHKTISTLSCIYMGMTPNNPALQIVSWCWSTWLGKSFNQYLVIQAFVPPVMFYLHHQVLSLNTLYWRPLIACRGCSFPPPSPVLNRSKSKNKHSWPATMT